MLVETDRDWFGERVLDRIGRYVSLSAAQIDQLYSHFRLLLTWNQRMNLSAVRSPEEIVQRHYCESLFFAAHIPTSGIERVCDVGSGAGFPGVPIAVLHPEWKVSLIEAHQRKSVFLRESTRPLQNVSVIADRAETVSGSFDYLVSRAVASADVAGLLPRLALRIGLMISESDLADLQRSSSFQWLSPVRIPWSDNNLCLFGMFHVER